MGVLWLSCVKLPDIHWAADVVWVLLSFVSSFGCIDTVVLIQGGCCEKVN